MLCPLSSRVSPTVVSPLHKFEGTHDVRSAWGNTDAIDFVAIASSLQATNGTRIDRGNSLIMPLRFVRQAWPTTRRSRLYYAHKGPRTTKTSELVLAYQR